MIGGGDPLWVTSPIWGPPPPCKQALGEEGPQKCDVMEDSAFITV